MRQCSVEGCGRRHRAKGLCKYHYYASPEQRSKQTAYRARPERQARIREYVGTPERQARVAEYNASTEIRYKSLKRSAAVRKLPCSISLDEYRVLTLDGGARCHYCEGSISSTGSGLDRIDNGIGYTLQNVVPCCGACNKTRNDLYSYEEFLKFKPVLIEIRLAREAADEFL